MKRVLVLLAILCGCGRTRDMPERVDVHDTMPLRDAMQNRHKADSMLDTMPGGEMARGDSAAAMKLLGKKMKS